jgi:dTDP-4-dehydrorhamnose reductase
MKIALSGATGLVGSRFFDLLKNKYEIIPISSSFNVDITERFKLRKFLSEKNPAIIVHMAAKTNVDACEEDKKNDLKMLKSAGNLHNEQIGIESLDSSDWKGSKTAFAVNVIGTKNLADYASENNIRIIYISTDFVFGGRSDGEFLEVDPPDPVNWYGETKYLGEKTLKGDYLIARVSYPFGYRSKIKSDFVWTLANLLEKSETVKLISDQIITPTFIEDIVRGLDFLIEKKQTGLIHLSGKNHLSPSEIGVAIAREFGFDESKIELTTREELYKGRAPRPFKVSLKNDKLGDLGFTVTDFFEALRIIKKSQ